MCDKGRCSKCYHKDCLGGDVTTRGKWICPWHFCDDCGKTANILCSECPNSYCKAHASGQITELGNGIHVCCDHILTRKKTTQNQAEVENDGDDLVASPGIEQFQLEVWSRFYIIFLVIKFQFVELVMHLSHKNLNCILYTYVVVDQEIGS